MSLLWLRSVYFLLAALASYLDSMQQALAVVLILIASKIFLEAAGFEVPLSLFLGVLVAWRVLAVVVQLVRHRAAAATESDTPTHKATVSLVDLDDSTDLSTQDSLLTQEGEPSPGQRT